MRGTIQGEVKAKQADAVVVQMEPDQKEVRLPLQPFTHVGPIGEGDKVMAYVTPGGTITSVQPLDSRFYR